MKLSDVKGDLLIHVRGQFGWNGGIGDPPSDETILAIVQGTINFMTKRTDLFPKKENAALSVTVTP